MTTLPQTEKARSFAALHVPGDPVVLYNIWDAGSARAVAEGGARALATGSWSVAAAQGFPDGEAIPLDLLLGITRRIAAATDLPLSLDFEGGYSADPATVAENVTRVIEAGAIGINFEDRVVAGGGLYSLVDQCRRIAAIRAAADRSGVPLFINARTDLFLQDVETTRHPELVAPALERARAYAEAGADGFFVPWLVDDGLIAAVVAECPLPVNVLMRGKHLPLADVKRLGVARISYGPGPYAALMETLKERAAGVYV